MTWYGIEPLAAHPELLPLLSPIPKLQQFAVRRVAHQMAAGESTRSSSRIVADSVSLPGGDAAAQTRAVELLASFRLVLPDLPALPLQQTGRTSIGHFELPTIRRSLCAADGLAALFGDGTALADLRTLAADAAADPLARQQAIQALAQAKDSESVPILIRLLNDLRRV
ncbi:MAG UNVERIFIED_CONTAM: hypothetical protein LVR18_29955 [Planctomycetaceae bacterium]|jgi:hypothetical protein